MNLSNGMRLGSYEILAPLGAGGMGEVYRARDSKLNREVALKVLPEAFAKDAERMARFHREAQVLASLNHPNIAAIHGLEESGGVRALVMELVEGPTLADRIAPGLMPLDEALPIGRQMAEALEYAHEKGIIHRDLKPANVKLTAEGIVKVLDFGLAKALEGGTTSSDPENSPTLSLAATQAGVILGTAAYMAPEQARGKAVDRRADIWSFGVVLYEMLTGKRLYSGETISDTLAAVLKVEPDWDALPADVPAVIRKLLRRCLTKDRRERLQAIGEARIAIEEYQSDPTGAGAAELKPAATRRRRDQLGWALAGVLAIGLIVTAPVWWRSTQPVSQPLVRLNVDLGPEFAPGGVGGLVESSAAGFGGSVILSPDGRRVVYTGRGTDGKLRLYTRTFDQDQAAALGGTDDATSPFFAPDGQHVGFFAGGKLKTISVEGGGTVVLCDAPAGRGASWGDDGNIVAALGLNSGLSRVPSGGGTIQPATELQAKETTHRWPQVLPGDHGVLFTAHAYYRDFDKASIEVQSLRTGERKTLVRGGYFGRYAPSGHLLYVRKGTLYAAPMDLNRLELTGPAALFVQDVATDTSLGFADVDFSRSGTLVYLLGKASSKQTLVWLDSTGHTEALGGAAAEYDWFFHFSPDGKRLAMSVVESGNADVWVYEWQRDTMTVLSSAPEYDGGPVWSPDGKHILFCSARHGGAPNLYWMRADGAGEAVRLTESKNTQIPYSFSPDGKRVVFNEFSPGTNGDIWTLPLDEVGSDRPKPGKPEPFLVTPFQEFSPMISPDGRWVAYHSNESGSDEVYVRRFPGPGGKWQISTGRGWDPIWSKKGQELFYGTDQGMMVASYTVNGETFVAAKPRLWVEKKDLTWFDLAPDGKRFAVLQQVESKEKAHVTFLLNFFDELRRRAPAGSK